MLIERLRTVRTGRTFCSFAGVILLSSSPYSCHKPTDQELYAEARRCYAALDANQMIVPEARLEESGLSRSRIATAVNGNIDEAYDIGKAMRLSPQAISIDLGKARALHKVPQLAAGWQR